jgi:hypothetical protein
MPAPRRSRFAALSLDTWAVILSLALVVLIRLGVFKTIPW